MRCFKLSFIITGLLFFTLGHAAQASVTVSFSDAVKTHTDAKKQKDIQDKINKGLEQMGKTHKGAKALFDSGQTIMILCYGEPLAKKLGFKQDADAMMGLFGTLPGETKGDFKKDKTPKSKGTTYIAIDCDKLKLKGWDKPHMNIVKDTMWHVLIHELLHATNADRQHPPDELSVYQNWVKQFLKALATLQKSAVKPTTKPTSKPTGTLPETSSGSTGSKGTTQTPTTTPTPKTPEKGKDPKTEENPKYNSYPGSDGLIFSQPTLNPAVLNNGGLENSLQSNSLKTLEKSDGARGQSDTPQIFLQESGLLRSLTPVETINLTDPQGAPAPLRYQTGNIPSGVVISPDGTRTYTNSEGSIGVELAPLQIGQFFSSIQDGQVKAPQGFQAGDSLNMIIEGTEGVATSQVSMNLIASDSGETVQVLGTLSENVGAGIEGNRQIGEFRLPYDLPKGFYEVFLNLSEDSRPAAQIEISDAVSQNRRRELTQLITDSLKDQGDSPYTMVGPYSPLPVGAQIQDSDTGELITVIDQNNMWLFFRYDPTSFFGQADAKLILINGNSEQIQIFENREFWPNVQLQNGEPYPFQYGNRNHVLQQTFTTGDGIYFQDGNSGRKGPVAPQLATNTGRSIIGVPMKEGCDPKKVKKYAIFVTFNDIEKQFKQLLEEEKALVKKLGFDGTEELSPKDFLPDRTKAFGSNKVSLDALKQAILDILKKEEKNKCCLEIVLFINAHQNAENAVKIQHRFTYEKNKKTKSKNVNTHINNGKLVEFISQVLKDEGRTCIPTAIVFHSCNSGKFDSSAFDNAFKGNPNLRVYASSSAKQKTSGKLSGEEFFFIEGLKILLMPPKTFEQHWDEIVKETQKTWLDHQVDWCFQQWMSKKFGKNWRKTYRNKWNKETFEQKQKEIKKWCREKLKKKAQKPKRVGLKKS